MSHRLVTCVTGTQQRFVKWTHWLLKITMNLLCALWPFISYRQLRVRVDPWPFGRTEDDCRYPVMSVQGSNLLVKLRLRNTSMRLGFLLFFTCWVYWQPSLLFCFIFTASQVRQMAVINKWEPGILKERKTKTFVYVWILHIQTIKIRPPAADCLLFCLGVMDSCWWEFLVQLFHHRDYHKNTANKVFFCPKNFVQRK